MFHKSYLYEVPTISWFRSYCLTHWSVRTLKPGGESHFDFSKLKPPHIFKGVIVPVILGWVLASRMRKSVLLASIWNANQIYAALSVTVGYMKTTMNIPHGQSPSNVNLSVHYEKRIKTTSNWFAGQRASGDSTNKPAVAKSINRLLSANYCKAWLLKTIPAQLIKGGDYQLMPI